jgi:hypothetical protein
MKVFNPTIKFLSKIVLLFLVIASVVFACKDNSTVDNNVTPNTSKQSIKFEGEKLTQLYGGTTERVNEINNKNQNLKFLMSEISDSDISKLTSLLIDKSGIKADPSLTKLIVTYTTGEDLSNVSTKELLGISIFSKKSEGIMTHQLYRRNNLGTMELDTKYNSDCDLTTIGDFSYIAGSFSEKSSNIFLAGYYSTSYQLNKPNSPKVTNFSTVVFDNANFISSVQGCPCGNEFECKDDLKSCNGLCLTLATNDIAKNKGARTSDMLSENKTRLLRDNFMNKSSLGQKYVEYYYKLSDLNIRYNMIKPSNYLDYLTLGKNLTEILDLLSQNGNDKEVIIDKDLRNQTLELINKYRVISKNKELKSILDDIENDINLVYNKDKKQVLNFIKTAE